MTQTLKPKTHGVVAWLTLIPLTPAVAGVDPPQPAIESATQAVRQATPDTSNLPPAPTVTRWEPTVGNVDHGLITIEGQGFNPATVKVSYHGNLLTLVEKSATRVVARLGDWSSGSYFQGPLAVYNTGGHVRMLNEQYRILPRWPTQAPRFMSASRISAPTKEGLSWAATYQMRFMAVPGDEIIGLSTNAIDSSACAFGPYPHMDTQSDQPVSASNPFPIADDPQTFESGVRGSQELNFQHIQIATFKANGEQFCDVTMHMQVRYRDEPNDVREVALLAPQMPSPSGRKKFVVTDTYDFLTSKLFELDGSLTNTPLVCGYEKHGSKFRQFLNDTPIGSDCQHVFLLNNGNWKSGYNLHAWVWSGPDPSDGEGKSAPRCYIKSHDDAFPLLKWQMGWKRDNESSPPADAIRNVLMKCSGNHDSPKSVRAELMSVELEAPISANEWQDAKK